MFIRKALFLLLFSTACTCKGYAQVEDFCEAVTTIVRDAPNQFRNIKGRFRRSDATAGIWDCGVKVPGTIGSRFVSSMGLFYEGAFFQSPAKDQLRAVYDKYKGMLNTCLATQGYSMTFADNFTPGLKDYKKVVFMRSVPDDSKVATPPPHITIEAHYNKDIKKYTLVMYIFDN